jgi:hypothetical protein
MALTTAGTVENKRKADLFQFLPIHILRGIKAGTRILLYQVAKANLPVVRLSVKIEGPAKATVRLNSSNLCDCG